MEKYIVKLSQGEREFLHSLISTKKSSARKLMHARILLEADENQHEEKTDEEIAQLLCSSKKTVQRVRIECVENGIEKALERKHHSAHKPRKLQGNEEAHLIAVCCSRPPEGRCRWTMQLLADKLISLEIVDTISPQTILNTLNKNELKPWQKKEWCIPEASAEFVCKMEDVLDVYTRPYDEKNPVVCVDESNKQLTKEKRDIITAKPGQSERFDTQYERNGTANIFMACEPLAGKRHIKITDQRTKKDFAHFIKDLVDVQYPRANKIVMVMDNLNTHDGSSLYETFKPAIAKRILDKLEIHYTPKHGSWLNMAEIELSHLSRQCLDRRIPDKETIIRETKTWCNNRNTIDSKIDWRFTTKDARIKLKRLYPVIT